MRLTRAIWDLVQEDYTVSFEKNPANGKFLAITLSNHGLHVRGAIDKLTEDQIVGSLKFMKERLDLMAKGRLIN